MARLVVVVWMLVGCFDVFALFSVLVYDPVFINIYIYICFVSSKLNVFF